SLFLFFFTYCFLFVNNSSSRSYNSRFSFNKLSFFSSNSNQIRRSLYNSSFYFVQLPKPCAGLFPKCHLIRYTIVSLLHSTHGYLVLTGHVVSNFLGFDLVALELV